MLKQEFPSFKFSQKSSFCGHGLYCPAQNNPSELSFPATLFLHRHFGYYVALRTALREDTKRKLKYSLQPGDVFAYAGGFIKIISDNTIDIYDALNFNEPIGSHVIAKSRYRRK